MTAANECDIASGNGLTLTVTAVTDVNMTTYDELMDVL